MLHDRFQMDISDFVQTTKSRIVLLLRNKFLNQYGHVQHGLKFLERFNSLIHILNSALFVNKVLLF